MLRFSVVKDDEPLPRHLYSWDERTKVFTTKQNGVIIDFSDIHGATFKTGTHCTIYTATCCVLDTRHSCNLNTGNHCVFYTGSYCDFTTGDNCTFDTGSNCTFDVGDNCTLDTHTDCQIKAGSLCVHVERRPELIVSVDGRVAL